MEEAAIVFVEDAAMDPPVKTAQQQKLPTDIILQLHQQLPQQQLVTSRLQQRRQQQHSRKCGPRQRFQQQPVSPQRCRLQPYGEYQVARAPSFTEGPAGAVDRSARSLTRGRCTEGRVKGTQPEQIIPEHHPTSSMASINGLAVDGKVGCADVIKRLATYHRHPMTSQQCNKAPPRTRSTSRHTGSSSAGRNRPRPVPLQVHISQYA